MADRPELAWRTRGEQLWLWRRRFKLTQASAARSLLISEYIYHESENDRSGKAPARSIRPTPGELCALARRRHGLGLLGTARLLGLTHVTMLARERRCDPSLITSWQKLGYEFP